MSKSKSPFLSLITITTGTHASLHQCIRAVSPQLKPDDEWLIISQYPLVLKPHPSIRVLLQDQSHFPHQGGARNQALQHTSHPWIVFTDDDCLPHPDWLQQIRRHLNPSTPLIQGACCNHDFNQVWSTLENITLHVYDQLPEKHTLMDSVGIKLTTKNLILHQDSIPYQPLFLNGYHPHLHDDMLLMIKLNQLGLRPVYESNIKVDHHPESTFLDYIHKLLTDGRTLYWKKYAQHQTHHHILTHLGINFDYHPSHQFHQQISHLVSQVVNKAYQHQPLRYLLFKCGWYLRPLLAKIGFLIESIYTRTHSTRLIKNYLHRQS